MSRFVVSSCLPASSYQLSLTILLEADKPYLVNPMITTKAKEILDNYESPDGSAFLGLSVACHRSNGLNGTVRSLVRTGNDTYTNTQFYPAELAVKAINPSPLTAAIPGSSGQIQPSQDTINTIIGTTVDIGVNLLFAYLTPTTTVPKLALAGAGALRSVANAYSSGALRTMFANTQEGNYRPPVDKNGLQVVVYEVNEQLTPVPNFTNLTYNDSGDSNVMGFINTVNNFITIPNQTGTPPSNTQKAFLDFLMGLAKTAAMVGDFGNGLANLVTAFNNARNSAGSSAWNSLMQVLKPFVEPFLEMLFNEIMSKYKGDQPVDTNQPVDPVTDLVSLFTAGNENNIFTSDLFPAYFAIPETGANITEVLINNPFPGTSPIPPYIPD